MQAKALNNPTYVYTFMCSNPDYQDQAMEEAEKMKMNGAVSSIIGFGKNYEPAFLRTLASRPDLFYPVTEAPNYFVISQWMIETMTPAGSTFAPTGTTPTTTQETTSTTAASTSTSTAGSESTTSSDSTAANPTEPATTATPACAQPDVVFIFERFYFDQPNFDSQIQPILTSLANSLDPCVKISTAYVEYGASAAFRYSYYSFANVDAAKAQMKDYPVGDSLGDSSNIHEAFKTTSNSVGLINFMSFVALFSRF